MAFEFGCANNSNTSTGGGGGGGGGGGSGGRGMRGGVPGPREPEIARLADERVRVHGFGAVAEREGEGFQEGPVVRQCGCRCRG